MTEFTTTYPAHVTDDEARRYDTLIAEAEGYVARAEDAANENSRGLTGVRLDTATSSLAAARQWRNAARARARTGSGTLEVDAIVGLIADNARRVCAYFGGGHW